MKTIKALFITVITACTFTVAQAQIRLPPPPPHPPLPRIHLGTPPPPPGRPGRVVISRPGGRSRVVVKRHYYYRHGVRRYRTY
ncbi:hypothetical protein [Mucilaginibacter sp. UR6-11]|uniref:hypothetical protein n=1 Tax=Mucilaginibacter sp. UR6-11 TaxID=1435644 RepID=UPI001E56585C|nr:hypothetical protein [Mucilaginibacter sp. UR6-11]MCC8426273.1 hypothetical protein [Mucilaginibacter sp. UR6-11]